MKYVYLALWVFIFEAVSATIGMITQNDVDGWYASLTPPPLVPPNIVFPIMWTMLYALIAAAGWSLWQTRDRKLLALFGLYMALNWSWSFIFFSAHMLLGGFLWILALNAVAVALIVLSWQRARLAAWLMIPPLAWTCFAAYLNGGYWWLNS